jgi:hypothetical protein
VRTSTSLCCIVLLLVFRALIDVQAITCGDGSQVLDEMESVENVLCSKDSLTIIPAPGYSTYDLVRYNLLHRGEGVAPALDGEKNPIRSVVPRGAILFSSMLPSRLCFRLQRHVDSSLLLPLSFIFSSLLHVATARSLLLAFPCRLWSLSDRPCFCLLCQMGEFQLHAVISGGSEWNCTSIVGMVP